VSPPIEIPTSSLVIGVPVRNQMDVVQRCLSALLAYRPKGSQIVIVDDYSDDHCRRYLETFAERTPGIRLLRNRQQRGFPFSCNEIIQQTSQDVICFLNSDALVSPNWAEHVLQVMSLDASFAMAGPSTSFTHTQQSLLGLRELRKLQDIESVREIAQLVFECYRGQYQIVPKLGGFCLFLKREVVKKIGGFDERFGLGCGEEDDLIARGREANFQAVWVKYSYVHHVGHCSFTEEMGTESARHWARNKLIYEIKRLRPGMGEVVHALPNLR
jgi:O-antigen biosynthesis protein